MNKHDHEQACARFYKWSEKENNKNAQHDVRLTFSKISRNLNVSAFWRVKMGILYYKVSGEPGNRVGFFFIVACEVCAVGSKKKKNFDLYINLQLIKKVDHINRFF